MHLTVTRIDRVFDDGWDLCVCVSVSVCCVCIRTHMLHLRSLCHSPLLCKFLYRTIRACEVVPARVSVMYVQVCEHVCVCVFR